MVPPEKPGAVPPGKPSAAEPSAAEPGALIIKNEQEEKEKYENNKENDDDLISKLPQPTDADKQVALSLLFLREGKTHCVNQGPMITAWVMATRATYGDPGVQKLLLAHNEPAKYGISRTWPRWKVDAALFEGQGKPAKTVGKREYEDAWLQVLVLIRPGETNPPMSPASTIHAIELGSFMMLCSG